MFVTPRRPPAVRARSTIRREEFLTGDLARSTSCGVPTARGSPSWHGSRTRADAGRGAPRKSIGLIRPRRWPTAARAEALAPGASYDPGRCSAGARSFRRLPQLDASCWRSLSGTRMQRCASSWC
ncbi:MAG: hypothetical protein MZV65_29555 [Chromatiales bacterium]|nr:hypothetical protein [Chromatiales bacterium]